MKKRHTASDIAALIAAASLPLVAAAQEPDDGTAAFTAENADEFLFDTPLDRETMKSGGTLTDLQRRYDVRHYGLALDIDPDAQVIEGTMTVRLRAVAPLRTVELDLDPRLTVSGGSMGESPLEVSRDGDKVRIALPRPMAEGQTGSITVAYGGAPYVAERPPWRGGFVWSETESGEHWAATAVQGRGCDLWRPCKDHYGDKPDEGIDLVISVPEPLRVASNGELVSETTVNGRTTAHWMSRHPYSGYAVALNIGPYERIETTFRSRDGHETAVEFWALPENAAKARRILNTDALPHLAFFEDLLGPYPWRDEKAAFVETPHLGMEHQTINAYGEGYKRGRHGFDGLLHHELAHEWFGNLITHSEAKDVWLHEGYGAYMQAVYAEDLIGDMAYADHMYDSYVQLLNCEAVVQPEKSAVRDVLGNGDVYTKGAWMLHTIREVFGEDLLWRVTRRLLYGTPDPWERPDDITPQYRSTEDFVRILSEQMGRDMGWFVEAYLLDAELPALDVTRQEGQTILAWQVGPGRSFPMPIPVRLNGTSMTLEAPGGVATIATPEGAQLDIDPEMKVLRRLPVIGSCEEQAEKRRQQRAERAANHAETYGWKLSNRIK